MEVHKKIKFVRQFRGWSQEKMAEKLGMTLNGYTNIELGKTDPPISRVKQISETLGVDLGELVGLNDKNVLNFIDFHHNDFNVGNNTHSQIQHNTIDQTTCKHELEKANLIIEQKDKEIAYLKEMIEMMKKQA